MYVDSCILFLYIYINMFFPFINVHRHLEASKDQDSYVPNWSRCTGHMDPGVDSKCLTYLDSYQYRMGPPGFKL